MSGRRKQGRRTAAEEAEGLPQASGGRKEYTEDAGNVTRAVEWLGFKLHLLVAVKPSGSRPFKLGSASLIPFVG